LPITPSGNFSVQK